MKAGLIAAALAAGLLLTGCAAQADQGVRDRTGDSATEEILIRLNDGRTVRCVQVNTAISCDWGSAK